MLWTASPSPSFSLNTEGTYDWKNETWSVPVNVGVNQVISAGGQMMQLGVGTGYWIESPEGGPEGWRVRVNFVLLYPKG